MTDCTDDDAPRRPDKWAQFSFHEIATLAKKRFDLTEVPPDRLFLTRMLDASAGMPVGDE